ncbi:phosphotransferase family protein [Marinobacter zhanjiangensis]|uniref:Aminoglycoside phosphotransferase n=1 Tax=Marinobacter zhanjiangensis TaxID=578215 RepID=A0ABQ3APA0_9GAMM|nr:phosphotransferase family protein [Marinobacter zhanjiangensis]GGY59290.1 putative aminoglycoside phosphotransferase [Marinobacter zhanjiangensis]
MHWQDHIDTGRLQAWMVDQGLGEGKITGAHLLGGGTQNLLLRFDYNGRGLVLRRPPPHLRSNSNETMRREMRMLEALAKSDVPHPRLVAGCPDENVLGAAFYLMEPVDGFAPVNGLPALHASDSAIRHRMGLSLVEGITALGAVDYEAVGLTGFGKPENYLQRQVSRWRHQLESYADFPHWSGPRAIPGVETVADWLERNQPPSFEPGIIHGDYHLGNVMYRHDSGELAAIVDWELTTIGDPLLDLGWLLATWPGETPAEDTIEEFRVEPWEGFPAADELVAHYRTRTQRDTSGIDWYAVLACYKLGIILEGTHARACAGKAPKATGDQLHASTVALFERALGWVR